MPVNIQGREYATVAERLKLAHGEEPAPVGIHSITTQAVQVGQIVIIQARVQFASGQIFEGSSMVNLDARGPAERDAPLETAETSAVGRALAFAGYPGSESGIAGAEELHLAQQRAEARRPDGSTRVTTMPSGARDWGGGGGDPRGQVTISGPTASQVRYLHNLWQQAGRPDPVPDVELMARSEVSKLIDELRNEVGVPPKP